jgi:hypothetical protein
VTSEGITPFGLREGASVTWMAWREDRSSHNARYVAFSGHGHLGERPLGKAGNGGDRTRRRNQDGDKHDQTVTPLHVNHLRLWDLTGTE